MNNRLLLDTHILIWFLREPDELDAQLLDDLLYNDKIVMYVSVETLREIVILQHLKKIDMKMNLKQLLGTLAQRNILILGIKVEHVEVLEKLSHPIIDNKPHEDPFDRMLISQAIAEHLTLVSSDKKFPYYKDKNFSLLQN